MLSEDADDIINSLEAIYSVLKAIKLSIQNMEHQNSLIFKSNMNQREIERKLRKYFDELDDGIYNSKE